MCKLAYDQENGKALQATQSQIRSLLKLLFSVEVILWTKTKRGVSLTYTKWCNTWSDKRSVCLWLQTVRNFCAAFTSDNCNVQLKLRVRALGESLWLMFIIWTCADVWGGKTVWEEIGSAVSNTEEKKKDKNRGDQCPPSELPVTWLKAKGRHPTEGQSQQKAHFTDGKMAAASETATLCQEEPLKLTMSFNPKSVIRVKQLEQQCALNLNH